MPRAQCKNTNSMKNQDKMFPPNYSTIQEVLHNENYPEDPQNTERRTIINMNKEFNDFKKYTKEQNKKPKEDRNKFLIRAQENINIQQNFMICEK